MTLRLQELISVELGVPLESVVPSAVIGVDIPCDSLEYTQLLLAVEKEFGVSIPWGGVNTETISNIQNSISNATSHNR